MEVWDYEAVGVYRGHTDQARHDAAEFSTGYAKRIHVPDTPLISREWT